MYLHIVNNWSTFIYWVTENAISEQGTRFLKLWVLTILLILSLSPLSSLSLRTPIINLRSRCIHGGSRHWPLFVAIDNVLGTQRTKDTPNQIAHSVCWYIYTHQVNVLTYFNKMLKAERDKEYYQLNDAIILQRILVGLGRRWWYCEIEEWWEEQHTAYIIKMDFVTGSFSRKKVVPPYKFLKFSLCRLL